MSHSKRQDIDWDEVDRRRRTQVMASLGLRAFENPFKGVHQLGAEWETRCESCGIKVIYCTSDQEPNLSIRMCPYCLEDK